MMTTFLSILLFVVFLTLGFIHFNWVIGGTWGFDKSLPAYENGEIIFNPRKIDSAIVGLGLCLFGVVYLLKSGLVNFQLPNWIVTYGGWIIPCIFILRAIGEFKYVGFFKKIKQTDFGKMDSKLFSPLCLAIGLIGIYIHLMK